MENINRILAERIFQFRKKIGLTQEALAEKLGVTFQAVSKWETERAAPDIAFLPRLADVFGCSIDDLFAGAAEQGQSSISCLGFPWEDDHIIRGIVCEGRTILQASELVEAFTFEITGDVKSVACSCNLSVKGSVSGGCNARGDVTVGGNFSGGCNCSRSITVGGNMSGGCNAGGDITCGGNLRGDVCAREVTAAGDVRAEKIKGNVTAAGNIETEKIDGNVSCNAVECSLIRGNVTIHQTEPQN